MKGIDVSKWQATIDWKKVRSSGIEFTILRAGLGRLASQKDTYFDQNMRGATSNDIPVGVYWYSYATSVSEAVKEAEACLEVIAPYRNDISLPVFFDQEYEPNIKALNDKLRTDICLAFMERIEEDGYRTGLYCSYDWYMNWVERSRLSKYPVWIAQYANKCNYTGSNLIAWQYTSGGKVSGISGNVDMNEGYSGLIIDTTDGWKQSGSKWKYYKNGSVLKSRWLKDGDYWYYLGSDGSMQTGWISIKNKTYYLNEKRVSVNGVTIPSGACLITDSSGALLSK